MENITQNNSLIFDLPKDDEWMTIKETTRQIQPCCRKR